MLTNSRETLLLLIHKCAVVAVLDIVTRPLSFQLLAHILFHLFIRFIQYYSMLFVFIHFDHFIFRILFYKRYFIIYVI